jgi:HTH-type transcriptional regulator/antitoxin HigA
MSTDPIRNENEHAEGLSQIERLWGADKGTPESDRLERLVTSVEAYERAHFPIDVPDPA